jgi:hypothetical protein
MDRKILNEVLCSEGGSVMVALDPRFPLRDVETITLMLQEWDILVPGYQPPAEGILSMLDLISTANMENEKTVILPDRNLVTRMASIAKDGVPNSPNLPTIQAASLMALAQSLDFYIEPSVAFHELASREGNTTAHSELSWFRAADEAQSLAWIDLALGRAQALLNPQPISEQETDLAFPPDRWRRNYAVALKMAELELAEISNVDRLLRLMQWMIDDFIFAGPAACFAAMYYSPTASRGGMIKHLRSPDRCRAIAGVKNAAWDITYISDFVRRAREPSDCKTWYILATADKNLMSVASLSNLNAIPGQIAEAYSQWWSPSDANKIESEMIRHAELVKRRPMRNSMNGEGSPVDKFISSGEAFLNAWLPTP